MTLYPSRADDQRSGNGARRARPYRRRGRRPQPPPIASAKPLTMARPGPCRPCGPTPKAVEDFEDSVPGAGELGPSSRMAGGQPVRSRACRGLVTAAPASEVSPASSSRPVTTMVQQLWIDLHQGQVDGHFEPDRMVSSRLRRSWTAWRPRRSDRLLRPAAASARFDPRHAEQIVDEAVEPFGFDHQPVCKRRSSPWHCAALIWPAAGRIVVSGGRIVAQQRRARPRAADRVPSAARGSPSSTTRFISQAPSAAWSTKPANSGSRSERATLKAPSSLRDADDALRTATGDSEAGTAIPTRPDARAAAGRPATVHHPIGGGDLDRTLRGQRAGYDRDHRRRLGDGPWPAGRPRVGHSGRVGMAVPAARRRWPYAGRRRHREGRWRRSGPLRPAPAAGGLRRPGGAGAGADKPGARRRVSRS